MFNIKSIISPGAVLLVLFGLLYSAVFLADTCRAKTLQARGYFLSQYQPKNTESIAYLKRSISLNSDDFRSKWFLAQIYYNHGMFKESADLTLEILKSLELSDIRILLYKTYARMQDYHNMAEQSMEIFKKYGFSGNDYKRFSTGMNNLIEYRIMALMAGDKQDGLENYINYLFDTPFDRLPYEHFRGLKYALGNECADAVRYFLKYNKIYINKQILALYACCLEKEGYTAGAQNLIRKEKEQAEDSPVSSFLVAFYEKCK